MSEQKTVTVTDSQGRKIEIRKLRALERMRLVELVGAQNAENDRYLGYATLGYCVNSIDGNPVGTPGSKLALESIVQELDDAGLDAVAKAIEDNFLPKKSDEGALKNG